MRTPDDYTTWLTKQQAADAIGVSTKAIERFTKGGKLEQAFRPQPGSPDVAVYFPDDVAKLAAERRPGPSTGFVVPGPTLPSNGHGAHAATALVRVPPGGDALLGSGDDLLRALVTAAVKVMSQTSETSTLFLTLQEASAYSGLTQAYLRRKCADGTLPAVRDLGWRIRRKDLEAL